PEARSQHLARDVRIARVVRFVGAGGAGRAVHFFFQAEDGIRDRNVTGVQTCALPISFGNPDLYQSSPSASPPLKSFVLRTGMLRSEERRVGKECRSGLAPHHYKKNSSIMRRCVQSTRRDRSRQSDSDELPTRNAVCRM